MSKEIKYTDDEIVKALACCADSEKDMCNECPLDLGDGAICIRTLCRGALDLINRKGKPQSREKMTYDQFSACTFVPGLSETTRRALYDAYLESDIMY